VQVQTVRAGGAPSAHVAHTSRSVRAQVSLMCHFTAACPRCPPQHRCLPCKACISKTCWRHHCLANRTGSCLGAAGSGCGGEDRRARAAVERV